MSTRTFLTLMLLLPCILWAQQVSHIEGIVMHQNELINPPSTIELLVYEFTSGTQNVHQSRIEAGGRFRFALKKAFAQDILLKYGGRTFPIYIIPGSPLVINIDAPAFVNNSKEVLPFEFMGKAARINEEIQQFSMVFPRLEFHEEHLESRRDMNAEEYKAFRFEILQLEQGFIQNYLTQNQCSKAFQHWVKTGIFYGCANDLMRYRWLHPVLAGNNMRQEKVSISYFDFLERFPLDNDSAIVHSHYGHFLREYSQFILEYRSKDEVMTARFSDYVSMVQHNAKGLTADQKERLAVIANTEISSVQLSDLAFLKEVLEKNDELRRQVTRQSYLDAIGPLLSLPQGTMKDAFLSWHMYELMDDFDVEPAELLLDTYTSEVASKSFRDRIDGKFSEVQELMTDPKFDEAIRFGQIYAQKGKDMLDELTQKHPGKVIYMSLWTTWSNPCIEELREAKNLIREFEGQEVVFIHVNARSPEDKWKAIVAREKINGHHYRLNEQQSWEIANYLRIKSVPHYILIAKNGKIVSKQARKPSSQSAIAYDLNRLAGIEMGQSLKN